jgi:hypothetical protein
MVVLYRLMAMVIKPGFKGLAVQKSEFNAFVSENIMSATANDGSGAAEVVLPELMFAKGTMGITAISSIVATDEEVQVDVNWDSSEVPVGSSTNDTAVLVGFNAGTEEWSIDYTSAIRSEGTAILTFPSQVSAGEELTLYLFFVNMGTGIVSDSVNSTVTV